MPFVEKLLYNNEVWEAGRVTYLGQKMGPSRSQWNWTEIAASRRVDPPRPPAEAVGRPKQIMIDILETAILPSFPIALMAPI